MMAPPLVLAAVERDPSEVRVIAGPRCRRSRCQQSDSSPARSDANVSTAYGSDEIVLWSNCIASRQTNSVRKTPFR